MVLRWRHRRALDALGRAVSDPSSSSYGEYLSPAQFRARFSPRPAAVRRVSRWLAGHGFDITGVSKSRMLVNATGSVGQAERAFAAPIRVYRLHGREAPAPARPLTSRPTCR